MSSSFSINSPQSVPHIIRIDNDNENEADLLTISFKISDDSSYRITCPRLNAMDSCKKFLGLETQDKIVEFDITHLNIQKKQSIFELLAAYINDNETDALNIFKRNNMYNNDSSLMDDLFDLYKLAHLLKMVDLKNILEDRVVKFINNHEVLYNYEITNAFLICGIKFKMYRVISKCFPRVLGRYWEALERSQQQLSFVANKLVTSALSLLKHEFTALKITGPCLRAIQRFRLEESDEPDFFYNGPVKEVYRIPREIQALFPQVTKAYWHSQRGCFDFNHFIALDLEYLENKEKGTRKPVLTVTTSKFDFPGPRDNFGVYDDLDLDNEEMDDDLDLETTISENKDQSVALKENVGAINIVRIENTMDPTYLKLMGGPLEIAFKISEDCEYRMICPKDLIKNASDVLAGALECPRFEVPFLNLKNNKLIFVILSEYLTTGLSKEICKFNVEFPDESDDEADEKTDTGLVSHPERFDELFDLYKLANFLEIEEIKNHLENTALKFMDPLRFDYSAMKEFMKFGIELGMQKVISKCFPNILGQYWATLELDVEFDAKNLLDSALAILKENDTKLLKITGHCLKSIQIIRLEESDESDRFGFLYSGPTKVIYSIPKKIIEMFPNIEQVYWHTQRGFMDFDRYIDLKVEYLDDEPVLVEIEHPLESQNRRLF